MENVTAPPSHLCSGEDYMCCRNDQGNPLPSVNLVLRPIGFQNGEVLYEAVSVQPIKTACSSQKRNHDNDNQPYVKKPPNAFMLFLKEQRASVGAELNITDSPVVNTILGQRWNSLSLEQKAKYYREADAAQQLHKQQNPDWCASDNYGKKCKMKKERCAVPTTFEASYSQPEDSRPLKRQHVEPDQEEQPSTSTCCLKHQSGYVQPQSFRVWDDPIKPQ